MSSGAREFALGIAAESSGAGAGNEDYALAGSHGGFKSDGQVRGDFDARGGKTAFEKSGDATRHSFAARSGNPRADAADVGSFQLPALKNMVRGIAERKPSLGVPGAQRIGRTGRGEAEHAAVLVNEHAIGFCPATVESQIKRARGIRMHFRNFSRHWPSPIG